MFNCDIDYRRSVAVLCMLYKIRCNPMYPICGALPGQYVPEPITRVALVAHRYTYAPPRCRTSQCRMTFILFSVSLWNDVSDPVFDGVGLSDFKSRANAFLLTLAALFLLYIYSLLLFFSFSSSLYRLVLWGWGLRTDRVYTADLF